MTLAIVILLILIIVYFCFAAKKETLAPMLKKALDGEELSYLSNIGPGFRPTSF